PAAPALVPAEPAALPPAEPPAAPPVCAHDTLARPTSAAATAAVIVLTITVESPWSVEENCTARACKSNARSTLPCCVVSIRPEQARRGVIARTTATGRILSPRRVSHERATTPCLPAERAVLLAERHASFARAEPRARFRRAVRHGARRSAVPLRRLEEQALLRRH